MTPRPDLLRELECLGAYVEGRVDLVQASGGNASAKALDGAMYVKASGSVLSDVGHPGGFAEVDCSPIRRQASATPTDLAEWTSAVNRAARDGVRPSMELSLHAMLDRVVLHTHPVVANIFLCASGGRTLIERSLSTIADTLFVDYAMPGLPLGIAIARSLNEHRHAAGAAPPVLLLENHGVVVHGETARDVIALHDAVIDAAARTADQVRSFAATPATASHVEAIRSVRRDRPVVFDVMTLNAADVPSDAGGPLFPDAVVFCGPEIVCVGAQADATEYAAAAARHRARWHSDPVSWRIGSRFVATGRDERQARWCSEVLWAQEAVRELGASGRPRALSEQSARELMQSDAEIYRQSVSSL